jgi:hypothetical protein
LFLGYYKKKNPWKKMSLEAIKEKLRTLSGNAIGGREHPKQNNDDQLPSSQPLMLDERRNSNHDKDGEITTVPEPTPPDSPENLDEKGEKPWNCFKCNLPHTTPKLWMIECEVCNTHWCHKCLKNPLWYQLYFPVDPGKNGRRMVLFQEM